MRNSTKKRSLRLNSSAKNTCNKRKMNDQKNALPKNRNIGSLQDLSQPLLLLPQIPQIDKSSCLLSGLNPFVKSDSGKVVHPEVGPRRAMSRRKRSEAFMIFCVLPKENGLWINETQTREQQRNYEEERRMEGREKTKAGKETFLLCLFASSASFFLLDCTRLFRILRCA